MLSYILEQLHCLGLALDSLDKNIIFNMTGVRENKTSESDIINNDVEVIASDIKKSKTADEVKALVKKPPLHMTLMFT